MRTLDVYKQRQSTSIKLGDRTFKIPNEYTVEEVERLLELQARRDEIESEKVGVSDTAAQAEKLKRFWEVVFDQLEIIFQHHQPEVTGDELRSLLTRNEALEILGFYDKYRQRQPGNDGNAEKKKPE